MVKTRTARRKDRRQRRSARKALRKSRRATRHRGGAAPIAADLSESAMDASVAAKSLAQGGQFMQMNKNFHGGSAPLNAIGASFLTPDMAGAARVGSLDAAMREIAGMQDGGRRRRRAARKGRKASRKGRKASRKGRKSHRKSHKGRKGRKSHRKGRRASRMRGGAAFVPGEVAASPMLLSGSDYSKAGLNPEWRDIQANPMMYAPK